MSNPALTSLSNNATVEDVVEILKCDGGVIIEDFLAPDALAGLQQDLFKVLRETPTGIEDDFAGTRTRRAGAIFAKTKYAVEIVKNPLFLDAARAFLCLPVKAWVGETLLEWTPTPQVGVTQAIQIGPGQGAQPLHRDDGAMMWRHPEYGREARVQIMLAVSEFTAENGGTLVIPRSHQWDDARKPERHEAISTVMRAGSALIFWVRSTMRAATTAQMNRELVSRSPWICHTSAKRKSIPIPVIGCDEGFR